MGDKEKNKGYIDGLGNSVVTRGHRAEGQKQYQGKGCRSWRGTHLLGGRVNVVGSKNTRRAGNSCGARNTPFGVLGARVGAGFTDKR